MGALVRWRAKPEFDKYASTKSGGQALLSAGLITDNIVELVDISKAGPESEYYFYPLMVILSVTLALNVLDVILALILGYWIYPVATMDTGTLTSTTYSSMEEGRGAMEERPMPTPGRPPSAMRIMNNVLTVTTALVFILIAIKSSLKETKTE